MQDFEKWRARTSTYFGIPGIPSIYCEKASFTQNRLCHWKNHHKNITFEEWKVLSGKNKSFPHHFILTTSSSGTNYFVWNLLFALWSLQAKILRKLERFPFKKVSLMHQYALTKNQQLIFVPTALNFYVIYLQKWKWQAQQEWVSHVEHMQSTTSFVVGFTMIIINIPTPKTK